MTTPRSTTARRAPQDHLQPKGSPEEKPEGWQLLKPFDEVPAWDQADLIAIVQPLMQQRALPASGEAGAPAGDAASLSLDMKSFDFQIVGHLTRKLCDFAVERDELIKFMSGKDALSRSIELAMWYVGQLGE